MNSNQSRTSSQFNTESPEMGDQDVQMPLGLMGESADAPDITGSSGGRKLSSGSILLVIVIVVAIAGLFSMRTIGKVTSAATGSSQIEDSINEFIKKFNPGEEDGKSPKIVGNNRVDMTRLGQDYTEQQVALADVQKNPFILPNDVGGTTPTIHPGATKEEVRRAELAAEFQTVGNRLRLKSIILGADPLANVSGRIVRLNETILIEPEKVEFLVTAIENETITLKGTGEEVKQLGLDVEITLQINRHE